MKRFLTPFCVVVVFLMVGAAEKTNLLKPANKVDSWRFEQHEQAKGTIEEMRRDDDG